MRSDLLRRARVWGPWLATGLVAFGILWLVVTALLARSELNHARSDLASMRANLVGGDIAAATRSAASFEKHAHRAHQLTTGPAWAVGAAVPGVGDPARTVRGVTAAVDALGQHTVPDLVQAANGLDPKTLVRGAGRIDVAALQRAAPAIARAAQSTADVRAHVDNLPGGWFGPVASARRTLQTQLSTLSGILANGQLAADSAPTLLGADHPQRYFVGFLNSAEARGVGGLPGAFVILLADHGTITITHYGSDNELLKVHTGLKFADQYTNNYRQADPTNTYTNSTISPHFPYAAQIWAAMWEKKSGQHVDGAIALDPTALSYLLHVTGPTRTTKGQLVSAGNVVKLTQQVAYDRYPNNDERKAFLLEVARAADEKILKATGNASGLLKAAGKAVGQRRLLLWTSDHDVENRLLSLPLSGALSQSADPYAGFVVNNAAGSKLDYYLQRKFKWRAYGCGARRTVGATITLTNTAPANLPPYATIRADKHSYPVKPGDNRILVTYYATTGATFKSLKINGKPATAIVSTELNHPIFTIDLELPRGATRTISFVFDEPAGGAPTLLIQPLINPLQLDVVKPQECR